MATQRREVLYTHMKTQKRKKWKEGECVFTIASKRAAVYARHESSGRLEPGACDEKFLEPDEMDALLSGMEEEFETEKFIVQIQGPVAGDTTSK